MKAIKKSGLGLLFMMLVSMGLSAIPDQPWDHEFNPALLSTGKRHILELGMSTQIAATNSYFTLGKVLQPEFILDLNEMSSDLGGQNLDITAKVELETHLVLSLFKVSVGGYAAADGLFNTGVPYGLVDVLADGIRIDEPINGKSTVYGRMYSSAGIYLGYRWRDWQFGTKIGGFVPLAFTDDKASYQYAALLEGDGTISASAAANLPLYSFMDFSDMENFSPDSITDGMGYQISLGAVRVKDNMPKYGFQMTGITLSPAQLSFKSYVTYSTSVSTQLDSDGNTVTLASYEDGTDPFNVEEGEFEAETLEGNYKINMPFTMGGFYRQSIFNIVDVIGHGEVVVDNGKWMLGAGATLQGAFFPLNIFSYGISYDRMIWENTLGIRFNLHVLELGLDIGVANNRIGKMFSSGGATAELYLALGL